MYRNYLIIVFALGGCASGSAVRPRSDAAEVEITRAGTRPPAPGPAESFTGRVMVTMLFQPTAHTLATGASVAFDPGARTAWHVHPAGQTLVVTAGTGWVQAWGAEKQEIRAGDVIWTPPGVKHWHGATEGESMTHLAVFEHVDGKVVDWLEHVSDSDYRR